jgi:peptidoglycan/xylan/chitin deacetylase (PgdA/CDA1 family)
MIFKYEELRRFFSELNKSGKSQLFKDWTGDKVFLVRHDVDFDINLAHKLAQIEKEENIVSTFFILTTCESYNVLSKKNSQLLKEMIAMGHEIGLHFDPTLYIGNLETAVEKEAEILSFACGEKITSISLHNPSLHGQYPMFDGYVNAYDPKMFSDENYISDSRYLFRGKNPYEFLNKINESMVQILLHPMHYSETGGGYDEVLSNTFIHYMNEVHNNFKVNSTYRDQVGDDFMSVFKRRLCK